MSTITIIVYYWKIGLLNPIVIWSKGYFNVQIKPGMVLQHDDLHYHVLILGVRKDAILGIDVYGVFWIQYIDVAKFEVVYA